MIIGTDGLGLQDSNYLKIGYFNSKPPTFLLNAMVIL
jgi:hypothetical protein